MTQARRLPSIDALLNAPALAPLVAAHGVISVKQALRTLQAAWRERRAAPPWSDQPEAWAAAVEQALGGGYRTVFNLTGTVIHTNLGRAVLDRGLFDEVADLVTRPLTLEFDLDSGRRGHRDGPVERRLCALTGAEAACVVNNNAAALMLVLNSLALDRAVPVSRGELIEIGGSFRLPDIMARAGCRLLEVGTTNRTHARDFRDTAGQAPALLLKVHPSNFSIQGFTHEVPLPELAAVARELGVPLCVDLGSGSLVDLTRWGLPPEPTPADVLAQGADLVTFSGDKLLGGAQAGLIVGRRDLVDACQRNPMKRALRADKITLTVLERLLARYEAPERLQDTLPLLRTLTLSGEALGARADAVRQVLAERLPDHRVEIAEAACQIGSGALPDRTLPSVGVRVTPPDGVDPESLHAACRRLPVPVVGRVTRGALWLDMHGAEPLDELLASLSDLGPER